jgi:hypothetical protein
MYNFVTVCGYVVLVLLIADVYPRQQARSIEPIHFGIQPQNEAFSNLRDSTVFETGLRGQETTPLAPQPREKSGALKEPLSKLLVGKWKLHSSGAQEFESDSEVIYQFTLDGKFSLHSKDSKYGLRQISGTYKVLDDGVRLTSNRDKDNEEITKDSNIDSITDTKLIFIGPPPAIL